MKGLFRFFWQSGNSLRWHANICHIVKNRTAHKQMKYDVGQQPEKPSTYIYRQIYSHLLREWLAHEANFRHIGKCPTPPNIHIEYIYIYINYNIFRTWRRCVCVCNGVWKLVKCVHGCV